MNKNCGSCNAWRRVMGDQGHCQAHPPVPVMIGMAQGIAGPQPAVTGYFPPVKEEHSCRQWQPKLEALNG